MGGEIDISRCTNCRRLNRYRREPSSWGVGSAGERGKEKSAHTPIDFIRRYGAECPSLRESTQRLLRRVYV